MHTHRSAAARAPRALIAVMVLVISTGACTAPAPSPTAGPTPSPLPTPTPIPTPLYSNAPDAALAALIPPTVAGQPVVVPAVTEFALTPGDIGGVYGDLGLRFRALQVAFVQKPRLSLFAVHMSPPEATTAELEPYLAAAGEYIGISGLHLGAWTLQTIGGRRVWVRPGDAAMVRGTTLYTWATGGYLFLMLGVSEEQNLAMLAALPGEAVPTPTPAPSLSPGPGGSQPGSPSPS